MATLTTVVSRIDMTAPSSTTPATIRVSRSSPSGWGAGADVSAMAPIVADRRVRLCERLVQNSSRQLKAGA